MPLSNLLQTYMMLSQIKAQERQADQQDAIIHDRRLSEALQAVQSAPQEQRSHIVDLYAPHLSQHDAKVLMESRGGWTENADTQRNIMTSQGVQSMNPQDRTALTQEAAANAFAGQNRAGIAGSGVTAAMFQNLSEHMQDPAFASSEIGKALAGGFAARAFTGNANAGQAVANQFVADRPDLAHEQGAVQATGLTALPRAQEQAIINTPGAVDQTSAFKNGLALSAPEQANVDLGWAGVRNNRYGVDRQFEAQMLDAKQRMAAAQAKGGMTGEQYVALNGQLKSTLDTLSQKDLDARSQNMYVLQYNNIAKQLGMPSINPGEDIPAKISWVRAFLGGFSGPNQYQDPNAAPAVHPALSAVMSQNGAQFYGAGAPQGSFNPNPMAR